MITVFTICSNNYLAQAKALGTSLMAQNPEFSFHIFLVDRLSEAVDYTVFAPFKVIPIAEIGISELDEMIKRYDITELNTSVKPFIFDFLFKTEKDTEAIIYLDPDIIVYQPFGELAGYLNEYNIVVTPHFFTPIYDWFALSEPTILNTGLYNLGFIAVKRSEVSDSFLKWWMIKLTDQCYIDFANGMFVDQLWINFVPLYYDKVLILRNIGYNVAYWNFHERKLTGKPGHYTINDEFPLIFFHFSGYGFKAPDVLSKYQTRYSFEQRPDVVPLFQAYQKAVMENDYERYSGLPCYYIEWKARYDKEKRRQARSWSLRLTNKYRRVVKRVFQTVNRDKG